MIDRKNFLLISICILIVSLPAICNKFIVGADTIFHLSRLMSIADELPNQFPVLIYHSWLFDFGEPTGVFYPSLFLYPFAILYKIGIDLWIVYDLLFISIVTLATICMYFACKEFFGDKNFAYIVATVYISEWYFQIDLYARADLSEAIAMGFLPLAMISSRCLFKNFSGYKNSWIIAVIAYTGLIQSHIITTLIFLGFLFLFLIIEVLLRKKSIDWKIFFKTFIATIGLNAFFIIPFVIFYNSMETYIGSYSNFSLSDTAQPISGILSLIKHATLVMWSFMLAIIYRICRGYVDIKTLKVFLFGLAVGILVCVLNLKIFPWNFIELIPFIGNLILKFQFPYRFMVIGSIFCAISFSIAIVETSKFFNESLRQKISITSCLLVAVFSITFGGHIAFESKPQVYGWFFTQRLEFSDDMTNAVVDLRSIFPWDNLESWRESNHDLRINKIEVENGIAEIYYNSPEAFDTVLPIGYCHAYEIKNEQGDFFSFDRKKHTGLIVKFPAGTGIITVTIPRFDSAYDDYSYKDFIREDVKSLYRDWNSGFEPRVLNIDHRNGKIFVHYDLSKSESNSKIELPIFYFPGHAANIPIESSERHLIQIDPSNLESHGTIEIFYEGLPSFKIANIISLATLIFLLVKIRREGF